MPPEVVVILLSWNRKDAVLDSIARIEQLEGVRCGIVVVDNASSDGSPEAIAAAHPDVIVVRETVNGGFAGGVNRGLAEVAKIGAPYAWLLNDDTSFEAHALGELVAFANGNPRYGLLSPRLVDLGDRGNEQFVNGQIDWDTCRMHHNVQASVFERLKEKGATTILPGTALLCDMRVYRAIGPFDTRFFAYWEDTDYAVRAARAGFDCAVIASVVMGHAATRDRQSRPAHYAYYMIRNEALFWRLHQSRRLYIRWMRRWLSHSLEWVAESRDHGSAANADACVDGIWHALTRRFGPRTDHPPAPSWLRRLILARPYLLSYLIAGRFSYLFDRLVKRGS